MVVRAGSAGYRQNDYEHHEAAGLDQVHTSGTSRRRLSCPVSTVTRRPVCLEKLGPTTEEGTSLQPRVTAFCAARTSRLCWRCGMNDEPRSSASCGRSTMDNFAGTSERVKPKSGNVGSR